MTGSSPVFFTINHDSRELLVRYWPDCGAFPELEVRYGHVAFFSPDAERRCVALSETGCRGHFAPMAEIESFASVEDYVCDLVRRLSARSHGAHRKDHGVCDRQLTLF